jgi:hypothetical protein
VIAKNSVLTLYEKIVRKMASGPRSGTERFLATASSARSVNQNKPVSVKAKLLELHEQLAILNEEIERH